MRGWCCHSLRLAELRRSARGAARRRRAARSSRCADRSRPHSSASLRSRSDSTGWSIRRASALADASVPLLRRGSAASMPTRVRRSSTPNSRSRSRSSSTTEPVDSSAADAIRAVSAARTYGDEYTTAGVVVSANHSPSSAAWRSPCGDSGTSMSRVAMSISASPFASATSRARLPTLSAWRTRTSRVGHACWATELAMPRRRCDASASSPRPRDRRAR